MCGRIEKHSVEIGQRLGGGACRTEKNMWKTKNRKVLIRLRKDGCPAEGWSISLKKQYPAGCRGRTAQDGSPQVSCPAGTKGTVVCVDDAGQLHMQWDNGRTLARWSRCGLFSRIDAPAKKQERSGDAR